MKRAIQQIRGYTFYGILSVGCGLWAACHLYQIGLWLRDAAWTPISPLDAAVILGLVEPGDIAARWRLEGVKTIIGWFNAGFLAFLICLLFASPLGDKVELKSD